jgi:hypothetical protein
MPRPWCKQNLTEKVGRRHFLSVQALSSYRASALFFFFKHFSVLTQIFALRNVGVRKARKDHQKDMEIVLVLSRALEYSHDINCCRSTCTHLSGNKLGIHFECKIPGVWLLQPGSSVMFENRLANSQMIPIKLCRERR